MTQRRQKEAEKLDAAEEVRAQQELAIGRTLLGLLTQDVIFHELRNPLNGIFQCAQMLFESITKVGDQVRNFHELHMSKNHCKDDESLHRFLESLEDEFATDLESLESLNICAKHQKRIADDVLQMSKLSMNLVSLNEKPFNPLVETTNAIRMFEREAYVKGIELTFSLGEKYKALQIGWVHADPVRFSQVLVNFISNALRFTENAPTRVVDVTLDASEDVPTLPEQLKNTHEVSHQKSSKDRETTVFLISSIKDTGSGLTKEERLTLFQKFAQASPKTYSEYGGSGLGLFISRALVEVQGGQVSLESEKDNGTTVTFYIRSARLPGPPPETPATSRPASRKIKRKAERNTSHSHSIPFNILVVEDNLVYTCLVLLI